MRALPSWLLLPAVTLIVFGCGGGEQKAATETAKAEMPRPEASSAPAGYTEVAVADGGVISGTISYGGTAPAPARLTVTKDAEICGKATHYDESLVVSANGGIKDVVVSVKNISSGKGMAALGSEFVLDQHGCLYSPHVMLVPVGAPLKILNPDGILHNIHTYSEKNSPFNKSQPPFKKEMEATFTSPEIVKVKCDVHSWMSANVVVVDHPYHAVTDANGAFTISEVPPGTYSVAFWQEKLGTQTLEVTVAPGAVATLNCTYPAAASD